ncbi:hypothetical protein P3T21_007791 [Paraburkholderia sp. GAS334]
MKSVVKCSVCGTPLAGRARYCSQCRAAILEAASTDDLGREHLSDVAASTSRTGLSRVWEALLWLAVLFSALSVFFISMAGRPIAPNGNVAAGGPWLGLMVWCYLIAKVRRLHRAWLYAFFGLGMAFVISVIAKVVAIRLL